MSCLDAASPVLLCLDALAPRADHASPPSRQPWHAGAAALVAHARAQGWAVLHVLPEPPGPHGWGWVAVPGLSPTPSEPVFHWPGSSAFGAPEFAATLASAGAARLLLVGASVGASGLATALDAVRAGYEVLIARDALSAPPREWSGLYGLAALGVGHSAGGCARLTDTARLIAGQPSLRVIQGGRR